MAVYKTQELHLILVPERHQLIEQLHRRGRSDKAVKVDVHEGGHDHLAVEPVHEAAVARDGITEVLDLEGSLEAAGEEAAERADRRSEDRQRQGMLLERVHEYGKAEREAVGLQAKDGERLAVLGRDCATVTVVFQRADHRGVAAEKG